MSKTTSGRRHAATTLILSSKRARRRAMTRLACAAVPLLAGAAAAHADDWVLKSGAYEFDLGFTAGAGVFAVPNAGYGAGSFDDRAARDVLDGQRATLGDSVKTPIYGDSYVKPEIRSTYHIDDVQSINVNVSTIAAYTLGDGDANLLSYTRGHPFEIALEEAFIAYNGASLFNLGGAGTTVKFGRQNFTLDDGFILGDGTFDAGRRADFYLAPRTAFDGWGTASFNYFPVRGDIFVLRNSTDNDWTYGRNDFGVDAPKTSFVGFDATYYKNASTKGADGSVNYADRAAYGTIAFLHAYDADQRPLYAGVDYPSARRNGLNVFNAEIGGTVLPIPFLKIKDDATVYASIVYENNPTDNDKVSALAYFIEPGYTFDMLPWAPHIYYRYSHFSGQENQDAGGSKHSFDPLFYSSGVRAAFGTYFLGEIIGQYVTSNTNQNVNQIGLTVSPPFHLFKAEDAIKFDAIYYQIDYDHPQQAGATDKHLGNELDLIAEYTLDAKTTIDGVAGVSAGGNGIKEANQTALASYGQGFGGLTRHIYLGELFVTRAF